MDTLSNDITLPGIGDNSAGAPLIELLMEATAPLRARAADLKASAGRCVVTDDDTAKRAVVLAGAMKEHWEAIDKSRETMKKPHWETCKTIDSHHNGIAATLGTFDAKNKSKPIAGPMFDVLVQLDTYRRAQETRAAAERARLEEAARLEREKAAAALARQHEAEQREIRAAQDNERRIREAEAREAAANSEAERQAAARQRAEAEAARQREESEARQRALSADLDRRISEEAAYRLDRQAATTVAGPINSGLGVKAFSRPTCRAELGSKAEDLTAALRHCRRIDEKTLRACVEAIYARQVKAGVRELPGAKIVEDSATTIRR